MKKVLGPVQVAPQPPYPEEKLAEYHAKLVEHLEQWRDAVEPGTVDTVDRVLNCSPGCGCPDRVSHVSTCKGPRLHVPLDVAMAFLFPPEGGRCPVEGLNTLAVEGPLVPPSKKAVYLGLYPVLGLPRYIEKPA